MVAVPVPAGWHGDPRRQHRARYWDGRGWTTWVSDAGEPFDEVDPGHDEVEHLAYVEAFVSQAAAAGYVDQRTRRDLLLLVDQRRRALLAPPPPPQPIPQPIPVRTPVAMPRPAAAAAGGPPSLRLVRPPSPAGPAAGAAREAWARARTAIAGDLAIHGLVYLGVLLLFAGIFGLVVFAFGDVADTWRPVAELAVPTAIFGSAWFLRRRGAPFVADALTAVATAVVAVVFIASLSDGSPIPPDLDGTSLVAALTVGCLSIAGAYAAAASRRAGSVLRFAVAPMVWLAIAMAALGIEDPVPTGRDLATPRPAQAAIVAASLVVAAVLARMLVGPARVREVETSAGVAYGIVGVLALAAAAAGEWPAVSMAVTSLAGVVLAELLADRLGRDSTAVAQVILAGAAVASLQPLLGTGATATLGVLGGIGLAEWIGGRRPSALGSGLAVAAAGVALACSLPTAGWAVGAGLAAWTWVVARRAWRTAWLEAVDDDAWMAVAALLPVIPALRTFELVAFDLGLLLIAEVVAAVGVAARIAAADDPLWRWWPRTVLVSIGLGTAAAAADSTVALLVAAVVVAAGLAAAPGPFATTMWSTAAAVVWAVALVAGHAGVEPAATALVLGVAAVAVLASVHRGRAGAHLALIAHVVGLGTLVVAPTGGWTAAAVEAMFGTGWAITLVRQERGERAALDLVTATLGSIGQRTGLSGWVAWIPAAMTVASLPLLALGSADAADLDPRWWGLALASAAAVAGIAARLLGARVRTATTFTIGALLSSITAVAVLDGAAAPAAATLSVTLVVGVLAPTAGWPPILPWWNSIQFAAWTLAVAAQVGVGEDQWFAVLLGWGPAAAIATLVVDERRFGPRTTGQVVRAPSLLAPFVVASLASTVGLAGAYTHAPAVYGTCSFVVAAAVVIVAVQLRAGLLSVASYALAAIGLHAVLPFDALRVPWTIVAFSGALVGWRRLLARVSHERSALGRWDTAPIPVAVAAALLALGVSTVTGFVPATYLGAAALLAVVAAIEHQRWWLAGSVALALIGTGALGPGWLSLGLALASIAATRGAAASAGQVRLGLQGAAVSLAAAAWGAGLVWQQLDTRDGIVATTVASGVVALGLAAALRWFSLPLDWATVWAGAPTLGLGIGLSVALSHTGTVRDDGLVASGIGLAAAALAVGTAATPARTTWLRPTSVGLLGAAAATSFAGLHVAAEQVALLSLAAGVASSLVALGLITLRPASPWLAAWLGAGAMAAAAAIAAPVVGDLAPGILVAALLAASAEAAALGAATRDTTALASSPVLALAGWLVFADDALDAGPMWIGVPIGLALLVDTGLIRWRRRADGEDVAVPALVALDDVGMAFVLGAPLLEALVGGPLEALVAATVGALVAAWGVETRVRRRVLAGAAGVLAGFLLLLVLPLAPLVPEASGPVLWVVVAGIGVLVIAAAAGLEHGRTAVRHGIEHLESLMRGWE